MKQKCYDFYCTLKKQEIGDGLCCFCCGSIKEAETPGKMCEHEHVIREYTREV